MPSPMNCADDITTSNTFIQKQRMFQFLDGINNTFDKEHCDLLNQEPLPSLKVAYATNRREIARRGIKSHVSSLGSNHSEIRSGLVVKHRSDNSSFRRDLGDKTHLNFSYCGGSRHTKDDCLKLIGFPEWWEKHRLRKAPPQRHHHQTHQPTTQVKKAWKRDNQ